MSVSVVKIVVVKATTITTTTTTTTTTRLPLVLLLTLVLQLLSSPCECDGSTTTTTACPGTEITLRGPHGVIQTPNFPKKFPTPICFKWIIDSTNVSLPGFDLTHRKSINVYLTQMHLKDSLKFIEYDNYSTGWTTQFVVNRPDLLKTRVFRTLNRYLGIEFNLSSPYQSHLRTRDYFLNEYGFNITYEIVPETVPQRNDTCSFSVCSYAGKCFVSHDYKQFYCECFQGHFGVHCQNNYKSCDPQRNISVCARGTCRNIGSWSAMCYCPKGWQGPRCENPIRPVIKECPGPECDTLCSNVKQANRPCSCHNGRMIPKGWVRYEGKLKLADMQLSQWDSSRAVSKPSDPSELNILNRIETVLTQQLRTTNSSSTSVGNVSIISVGPASEFVFQFFGNKSAYNASFSALTNLKSTGRIDESLHLGGSFNFDLHPSLLLKGATVNKHKTLRPGEDFSLTCEAIGSPGIELRWFKDGIPVNTSLSTRYMYEDRVPRNSQDRSISVLILYQVTIFDRGTFTCQASDMGEEQCANLYVDVLLPPTIEIEPMSLTLLRNDSAIVTCFANNDSNNHSCTYTWYKDNEKIDVSSKGGSVEVVEDLDYPRGSLLRIVEADLSATYYCVVENFAGKSSRSVEVRVVESKHSSSCRRELDSQKNLVWEWTAAGQTSMTKCPRGSTGFAQRMCQMVGSKARWGRTDFSHCISNRLITINNTLQKIKMGFAVLNSAESLIELLASHLENATLYSGEGESMIHVLGDAGKYAEELNRVKESFPIFFETVTRLLSFDESCVHHRSLITLVKLVQRMATRYSEVSSAAIPSEFRSDVLIVETIRLDAHVQFNQFSYNFPTTRRNTEYPDWLHLRAQVPLDSSGIQYTNNQFASLVFTVYRNLTRLLSPNPKLFQVKGKSVELVSSIVSIVFPSGYNFNSTSHIHLEFDVSLETLAGTRMSKMNLTCGALDMVDTIQWKTDACVLTEIVNSTVLCQCDRFGQFALLALHLEDDEEQSPIVNFHWTVLVGSIVCIVGCAGALLIMSIHIQFRFRSNSLYLLKMLVCLTLIFSVLLIMTMRNESSSIALSTTLCSLLIISLCCQLTKSVHVLVSSQLELFPWLRSVSLLTLLGAVSFGCILPVWTSAAALSHSLATNPEVQPESVLSEGSPVFGTFIVTVSLVVLIFLVFYYKATLHLRALRAKDDSLKNYTILYRMKTLNSALVITLATLITILATVLYGNILNGVVFQYFFGFSTFSLGILVFVLYTVKSEYPIPHMMIKLFNPNGVMLPVDPENHHHHPRASDQGVANLNRSDDEDNDVDYKAKKKVKNDYSPGKRLENGQVSTGLLSESQSQANTSITEALGGSDATSDTFVGSSLAESVRTRTSSILNSSRQGSVKESFSVLNMKRPSISSSNKIPRSMTNPVHVSGGGGGVHNMSSSSSHFPMTSNTGLHHSCSSCCRKNKSFRSHSASISSMRNSCSMNKESFKPERGRCLLSEVTSPDYVMPSISNQVMAGSSSGGGGGMGTTTGLSTSSGLFSDSSSYIDHSPQQQYSAADIEEGGGGGERGITQFLTFHQQQMDMNDEKMFGTTKQQQQRHHHRHHFDNAAAKKRLSDPLSSTLTTTTTAGVQVDSSIVTVHFDADENASETTTDGSHHSPATRNNNTATTTTTTNLGSVPVISFHRCSSENLPEKSFDPKNNLSLHHYHYQQHQKQKQPATALTEQHHSNGSSSNGGGGGGENGYEPRKLPSTSDDSDSTEQSMATTIVNSATCTNLNKSDLLLVKKISHDLSILLDRPKNKGKDYTDVEL